MNGNSTETYTYDSHGNITKVKYYAYTTGELQSNDLDDVDTFRYEKADPWPDKLSGIKDGINEIVYDENGNPISLDDTTISWTNGRQLESFNTVDENGNETPFLSFTYDDSGIRTSKTFGDTTTYYTNIDGNVTSQYQLDENGNIINLAEFIYDSANEVIGFTYEGETYFYLKNLQNDVLGVIDSNCELIARYDYSTWGFHTGWSNDDINGDIYDVNPFRYRSYIYDEEMSMCYLQSRYYITTFGRFLNSDLPEYAQMGKKWQAGFNLFAYCCNDPVNKTDSTGYAAIIDDIALGYLIEEILRGIIIGLGTLLWAHAIAAIIQAIINAISNPKASVKKKKLSDVKAKKQSGRHYKIAYLTSQGGLITMGKKMSFIKALRALGITATTNSISNPYNLIYRETKVSSDVQKAHKHNYWGIYADSQSAAKALAVVLGYSGRPEIHSSGQYRHYHDEHHVIHIWYGSKYYY